MVLEKTLENTLDCKEIQPVHSEGDQPWDSLFLLFLVAFGVKLGYLFDFSLVS